MNLTPIADAELRRNAISENESFTMHGQPANETPRFPSVYRIYKSNCVR
jgi:hypothetical protein